MPDWLPYGAADRDEEAEMLFFGRETTRGTDSRTCDALLPGRNLPLRRPHTVGAATWELDREARSLDLETKEALPPGRSAGGVFGADDEFRHDEGRGWLQGDRDQFFAFRPVAAPGGVHNPKSKVL